MANEFKVKKGLIVNGSGSVILDVRGSQGQLFSVTDNLSGSLFSVADISGVPVFEVFSSGRVGIGTSNPAERLHVYGGNVLISGSSAGTELKVQDGATGAPIRLSSNGSGEAFLYIGGENSSLRRTGGDLNLFANNLDIKLSTNNGSTATLFLDTNHSASFSGNVTINSRLTFEYNGSGTGNNYLETGTNTLAFKNSGGTSIILTNFSTGTTDFGGTVKPTGNGTHDLGGANNRWATVYAANINTSTSSTFGHDIVLDDNVDHSPEIKWVNQANESWEMYNNSSGKFQIEQAGTSRIELSSGGLELKNGGAIVVSAGGTDQTASADTAAIPDTTKAEFLRIQHPSYTNGQYTHEFAKIDRSGNLPVYVRQSKGTANSFTNLVRFGEHDTDNPGQFAVFGDMEMDRWIIHGGGDIDTKFGFSGANTFKVHTGGSDRFSVTGDVEVVGSTDFAIPQGRKLRFDSAGGHTYISEESDSNLKIYVAGTEIVNVTNDFVQFDKYINNVNGSATTPAYNFTSHAGNGMYLEDYDAANNKEQVSIATDGTRRVRINEAGLFSEGNLYVAGDFRSFTNPWHATSGTSGAGFRFENTADSRILFDIAGTGNSTLYTVSTMAPSLTFGATAGQILRTENSEFAFGLANVTPYPLFIQGRNHTNGSRHIVLQPKGGNIGIGVDGSGANIDTLLHLAQSSTPVIKLERPGNAAIRLGVSGTDFAISRTSDTLASGNVMIIDDNYDTTFSGSVRSNGFTTDGHAKFYAWRAVDNTSSSENEYYRIARVTGGQSTRFRIDLTGRNNSYGDHALPSIGSIVGQKNNDNCYDIIYYNNTNISASTESEVAKSAGQVRVDNNTTDIYIQLGQYAEIAATAVISDTYITTFSNNGASGSAQPESFTASFETKMLNTSNFTGAGIGVGGSGTTNRVPKFTGGSTLGDSVITSHTNGNVGIGVTAPGSKLSIEANTGTGLLVNMTGSGGGSVFAGGGASYYNNLNLPASAPFYIAASGSTSSAPALSMGPSSSAFLIQASAGIVTGVVGEELLINPSGGSVGIGTNSPSATLHVADVSNSSVVTISANNRIKLSGDGVVTWGASANYGTLTWDTGKAVISSQGSNRLHLATPGNADVIVLNGANVGIGTSSPGAKFDVAGSNAVIWVNPPAGNHAGVNFRQAGTFKGFVGFNNSTSCVNLGMDGSIADGININSSHNVGIGTTSPDHQLHVEFANTDTSFSGGSGGAWGSEGIRIENTSATANTMAMLHLRNNDADIHIAGIRQGTDDSDLGFFFEGIQKIRFTNSGDVGIGETSPLAKLHVKTGDAGSITANTAHDDLIIEGSGHAGINIFSPAGNNYQYLAFGDTGGANRGYVRYYHGTDQMVLRAGAIDTVYINNGRVGIGTTSTSVGGQTYKTFINGGNLGIAGKIRFGEEVAGFGQYSTKGTGQLYALTSKTAYGQTGVGNGTVALVNETGTTATGITIKNTLTGNTATLLSVFRNNNTGTSGAFSGGGGSPTTLLKLTGQAHLVVGYSSTFSSVTAENYYSYGGGTTYYLKLNSTTTSLNARGDVIAFASSDIRMKEDIKPLDNPLEKLDKIKGVKFKWNDIHKDFKGKEDIGVIAQDVEKVLPEIVTTRDTGYKAVDYQKLSVLLIESVKELKKEVEELKKKINK